jgi:hypothetical protein
MQYQADELDDTHKFRPLLKIPYDRLLIFIMEYLFRRTFLIVLFWSFCSLFLFIALYIRIHIAGDFPIRQIILHSITGLIILPVIFIPVHEFIHIIPYYLAGARDIRMGMDLKQFFFYVTAHRFVVSDNIFMVIASFPFIVITTSGIILMLFVPDLWKWSISCFIFIHATMCAGDLSLINYIYINRDKKVYTWDDADKKEAYFYEKL